MPFGRRSGLKNLAATTCHTVYVMNLAIHQDWSLLLKEKISSASLASSSIPARHLHCLNDRDGEVLSCLFSSPSMITLIDFLLCNEYQGYYILK